MTEPHDSDGATIEYVGHATVIVSLDGHRLITDPLLRNRVAHLRRRSAVNTDASGDVDAVLVSHAHWDHLDVPSLKRLGSATPIVAPRGLGGTLSRHGFTRVTELAAGETIELGGLRIRATIARHSGRRGPLGGRADAIGYAVLGSQSVYFAGDTSLFPEMDGLVQDLDVALLPIWGWGPTLGRGLHLDPRTAAEAVQLLRPRVVIPIHWGTFLPFHRSLRSEPAFLRDPPALFLDALAALPVATDARILLPGQRTVVDPR